MKKKITGFAGFILMIALSFQASPARSQALEAGIDLGLSGFLGDLGGANAIGRPFVFDLETSLMKPAASLHLRYYTGRLFCVKAAVSYTGLAGNDSLIQPHTQFSPEWFRKYRNLSFQTSLIEGMITGELNLKYFEPGSKRYRVAPYLLAGIGVMHFNPKAYYNGNLVALQPLHTEGQGFDSLNVKPYSLVQPVFPVGVGLRYNLSESVVFGFEFRNYFTATDYIDDVSSTYVSQSQFNNYFSDPDVAALAYSLSRRSAELDPENVYGYVTGPGTQRGDAKKDAYFMAQFTVSMLLFNNSLSSSGFGGRNFIFAHKIRATHQMFNIRSKSFYKKKTRR